MKAKGMRPQRHISAAELLKVRQEVIDEMITVLHAQVSFTRPPMRCVPRNPTAEEEQRNREAFVRYAESFVVVAEAEEDLTDYDAVVKPQPSIDAPKKEPAFSLWLAWLRRLRKRGSP